MDRCILIPIRVIEDIWELETAAHHGVVTRPCDHAVKLVSGDASAGFVVHSHLVFLCGRQLLLSPVTEFYDLYFIYVFIMTRYPIRPVPQNPNDPCHCIYCNNLLPVKIAKGGNFLHTLSRNIQSKGQEYCDCRW
jgi:hypothetical protein